MSRIHTTLASLADVAAFFDVQPVPNIITGTEVTEGRTGLILREGASGRRILQNMSWGFPRLTREMRERDGEPGRVGLVADLTNPMWDTTVVDARYRCIVVLTHFANPDGDEGERTRAWFSLKDQPIMAWAGFCRNVPDFGPVYAGMTMAANRAIEPFNDRMPALLEPDDFNAWLKGAIGDVIRFQFRTSVAPDRIAIERTDDLWRSGVLPSQPKLI